jgi:hypothetical protein
MKTYQDKKTNVQLTLSGKVRISLVDLNGRVVYGKNEVILSEGDNQITQDTREIENDTYLCSVIFGKEILTQKLVITL